MISSISWCEPFSDGDLEKMFQKELQFLQNCLHINPKSYAVFNQRVFVMKSMARPNWGEELRLCDMFLKCDERNCKYLQPLTHLFPIYPFSSPWKYLKTLRFFDVFKGQRRCTENEWDRYSECSISLLHVKTNFAWYVRCNHLIKDVFILVLKVF